jgi:hypothetical protein
VAESGCFRVEGEGVVINLLRVKLPDGIFFSTSPFGSRRDAAPKLVKQSKIRFPEPAK